MVKTAWENDSLACLISHKLLTAFEIINDKPHNKFYDNLKDLFHEPMIFLIPVDYLLRTCRILSYAIFGDGTSYF